MSLVDHPGKERECGVTFLQCGHDQLMIDWKTYNPEVIAEFRANQGKVAQFGDTAVSAIDQLKHQCKRHPAILIVGESNSTAMGDHDLSA